LPIIIENVAFSSRSFDMHQYLNLWTIVRGIVGHYPAYIIWFRHIPERN